MTVCFGLCSPDEWPIGWVGDWISWSPSIVDASGEQCAIRDRIITLCSALLSLLTVVLSWRLRTGSMEGQVLGRPNGLLNFYWNRVNSINDKRYNYNRVITEYQSINQIYAIVFIHVSSYHICTASSYISLKKYTLIACIFSSY